MKLFSRGVIAVFCLAAAAGMTSTAAVAQISEVKDKAPLYTYVAYWDIPRARWADMAKDSAGTVKILDKAIGSGAIIAYGNNEAVVHTPEGSTHAGWWCATSMAGVLNTLDEFYKAGTAATPALTSATKHWDNLLVSRAYGWRSGAVKGGYVHGAVYKLKPEAPNSSVETISKSFAVPLFEKLMADGTVQAYQVAEQALHTADPDLFFIFYITPKAEGLDKVQAALIEAIGNNALAGPALASMADMSRHRDDLSRGDAVFK